MNNNAIFLGNAIGLRLPPTLEAAIARFRACVDPIIKVATPFNPMQVPHITLATGLHDNGLDEAIAMIQTALPIIINIGALTCLSADNYDVLAKSTNTRALYDLNHWLGDRFSLRATHPYTPHITVGYVRTGTGTSALTMDARIPCPNSVVVNELIVFDSKGKVKRLH